VCQKLSHLVKIWWSSDKTSWVIFLAHPVLMHLSLGHVTLHPGEFDPLIFFSIVLTVLGDWALSQISSLKMLLNVACNPMDCLCIWQLISIGDYDVYFCRLMSQPADVNIQLNVGMLALCDVLRCCCYWTNVFSLLCFMYRVVPKNDTIILQPYIIQSYGFQQNTPKEIFYLTKVSVWIQQLSIFCYCRWQ